MPEDDKLEKYIKIDPKTWKPDYIGEKEGQDIAGIAKDEKLCGITFKAVKIQTSEIDEETKEPVRLPGYEFECKPTKACKDKNAELLEKLEKIDDRIKAATPASYKEDLKKYKVQLQIAARSTCTLRIVAKPGADTPTFERGQRATVDELKQKKVINLFCLCEKIEIPKEPEPPKPKPPKPPKKPKK